MLVLFPFLIFKLTFVTLNSFDLKGKIFVNIEDKSEICVINANSLKVEQYWSIAPGKEPSGLAIDIKSHRLFS